MLITSLYFLCHRLAHFITLDSINNVSFIIFFSFQYLSYFSFQAFFTHSHIVLAYNTNQVTVVHLQKPNTRQQGPEKISNMEPKIFHAIIPGTAERKLARRISVNTSHDMFVIWTKSSQNEVFPWRPTIRDQDRANIHVFKLKG